MVGHDAWVDQDRKEGGMRAIRTNFRCLRSDKRGATAIEYGLIVALMALAMLSGLRLLGGSANGMWGGIQTDVTAVL